MSQVDLVHFLPTLIVIFIIFIIFYYCIYIYIYFPLYSTFFCRKSEKVYNIIRFKNNLLQYNILLNSIPLKKMQLNFISYHLSTYTIKEKI